jgi:predicted nucleic acid-binding protein
MMIEVSDQWELRISSSDASFAELCRSASERARATREAWKLFAEGIDEGQLKREARLPRGPADEHPRFSFVEDRDDRAILWHVVQEGADVLLTSDEDILRHRERLLAMGVRVMRPSEWLDVFLSLARGSEDALRLA